MRLTRLQGLMILALAKYRFMTCRLFALLGLGSMSAIRRAIRVIANISSPARLVQKHVFPPSARWGRIENVYALAPAGINMAAELAPGRFPDLILAEPSMFFELDYHHRLAVIAFRIRMEKALLKTNTYHLVRADHYFDKVYRKKTDRFPQVASKFLLGNGKKCIPDGMYLLRDHQRMGAFALECVFTPKRKRVLEHIDQHMHALAEGVISHRYNLTNQDYRALFLMRDASLRDGIIRELTASKQFIPFRNHFVFATIADTQRDVLGCWQKVGDRHHLFHFINGRITYNLVSKPRKRKVNRNIPT